MIIVLVVIIVSVLLADLYFYKATNSLIEGWSSAKFIKIGYWSTTIVLLAVLITGYVMYVFGKPISGSLRVLLQGVVFCLFVPRLISLGFFVLDDLIRLGKYIASFFSSGVSSESITEGEGGISRSRFLQLSGLGAFALFFSVFTYGIFKGAYNFNVIRKKIVLPKLPKAFEGVKIIQISDLHLGSFFSSKPIEEAIKLINQEQPDFIFFTGDLVNDIAEEAESFVPVLQKMQAKEGIYSILGNHDYGDYFYRSTDPDVKEKKKHNKDLMRKIHREAGFQLLLDESVNLEKEGERLAIIGIENWGAKARFPKYGNLKKAVQGTESAAVKLLLSHDPSHWEAQVIPEFKDIDVTFSGHTHGMQFGIEIPGFKWSPAKYIYKQWAGLYEKEGQQLYVNRGLGFLGYPGRVGISPEISVFELSNS